MAYPALAALPYCAEPWFGVAGYTLPAKQYIAGGGTPGGVTTRMMRSLYARVTPTAAPVPTQGEIWPRGNKNTAG